MRGWAALCFTLTLWLPSSWAHGRLIEPPSRASMWRYGFNSPPDYNDHESYCGGYTRQWIRNKGNCGICGDPWDSPQPRAHEAGGTYGQGIIVRRYKTGMAITIRIEITANHRGHFEFRLCQNNAPKTVATQHCLDQHLLRKARTSVAAGENNHPTRYYVGAKSKVYEMRYLLPQDVTCTQCVLQWRYLAANNWGRCNNTSSRIGCGPQEEFRACADIAIENKNGEANETPYEETESEETGNEDNLDNNNVDNTYSELQEEQQEDRWLMSLIIIMSGMFLAIFIYILLFIYFYGANTTIKPCWQSTVHNMRHSLKTSKGGGKTPIPPPRTKKAPSSYPQVSVVSLA